VPREGARKRVAPRGRDAEGRLDDHGPGRPRQRRAGAGEAWSRSCAVSRRRGRSRSAERTWRGRDDAPMRPPP
jgi:hypothetical protein